MCTSGSDLAGHNGALPSFLCDGGPGPCAKTDLTPWLQSLMLHLTQSAESGTALQVQPHALSPRLHGEPGTMHQVWVGPGTRLQRQCMVPYSPYSPRHGTSPRGHTRDWTQHAASDPVLGPCSSLRSQIRCIRFNPRCDSGASKQEQTWHARSRAVCQVRHQTERAKCSHMPTLCANLIGEVWS